MLSHDLSLDRLEQLRGRPVYARAGERVGRIERVLYDDELGPGGWLAIRRGVLRRRTLLAPAGGISLREDGVRLRYPAPLVDAAPDIRRNDIEATRRALYHHYRLAYPGPVVSGTTNPPPAALSKAPVRARARRRAGAVTLRSWVETKHERRYVALRRESIVVSRQPVDEPLSTHELGSQEVTITLFDEEPVVVTELHAKERIKVSKKSELAREPLPESSRGEAHRDEQYPVSEDTPFETGGRHDHHLRGGKRGNRQTA